MDKVYPTGIDPQTISFDSCHYIVFYIKGLLYGLACLSHVTVYTGAPITETSTLAHTRIIHLPVSYLTSVFVKPLIFTRCVVLDTQVNLT